MRITSTIASGLAMALVASACSGPGRASQSSPALTDAATSPTSQGVTTGPISSTPTTTPAPSTTVPATTTTTMTTTTIAGAVDPNAPEVVEPGDIPDNQVFITFTSPDGVYSVEVPEGWARTETGGVVTFTDKYNSIELRSSAAASAPTVESVTANGLSDVASDPTFALTDVKPVIRTAGTGVLVTYEIGSTPNPVTGKKALLAVERYVFSHNGTMVTLTLSGAKGADNVDPWMIVSDSLSWS